MNEDLLNLNLEESITEEELLKESEDIQKLLFIDSENAVFERTKGGFVSLKYMEKEYDRVSFYRTFPVTEPDVYISVREKDEKAREIGMIVDLNNLKKEDRNIVLEQLKIRYFTPLIEKIIDVKEEYGYAYFNVVTNSGNCRFTIHMGADSVTSLSENRILINDIDGNRFEIGDLRNLTVSERKKLDLFI